MSTLTLPPGTADRAVDNLFPQPDPYVGDPVGWTRERLNEFLWSKQCEVAESVRDHRFTTVRSAHGTGKSKVAGTIAAWWLDVHPVGEAFVVTTAPTDKQVKAILWREIGRCHRKGELQGRINLDAEWYVDQELIAYGRKPADHVDADEARQAFQGIHAKYVLVVIDEAAGVPKWLWEAVDTLVTNEASRVLAIGNPDDPSTEFAKTHAPASGWNRIHISAFDLPWSTGEEVPEHLHDVLTGETWVEERKKKWGVDSPLYISKVLGEFPEITEDTLITPAMLRKAYETELAGLEAGRIGVDIARLGKDETVVYRNRGGVIRLLDSLGKADTMKTAGKIGQILDRWRDEVSAVVDVIGIGAGVVDRLRERNYRIVAFDSSNKALQPRRFKNRRSEMWWTVRELIEDGGIDLDERDEDLAAELLSIKWEPDSAGRNVVEEKKLTARRLGHSPDRADAMMMSCVADADWMTALGVGHNQNEVDRKRGRTKKGPTDGLLEEPM